jgi:hypothetical protein
MNQRWAQAPKNFLQKRDFSSPATEENPGKTAPTHGMGMVLVQLFQSGEVDQRKRTPSSKRAAFFDVHAECTVIFSTDYNSFLHCSGKTERNL